MIFRRIFGFLGSRDFIALPGVGQLRRLLRVLVRAAQQRLGRPRPDMRLPPQAGRPQDIGGDPGDLGREMALDRRGPRRGVRPAQPCRLDRVLRLTRTDQYPVGDREQQRPQLLELLGPGHPGSSLKPGLHNGQRLPRGLPFALGGGDLVHHQVRLCLGHRLTERHGTNRRLVLPASAIALAPETRRPGRLSHRERRESGTVRGWPSPHVLTGRRARRRGMKTGGRAQGGGLAGSTLGAADQKVSYVLRNFELTCSTAPGRAAAEILLLLLCGVHRREGRMAPHPVASRPERDETSRKATRPPCPPDSPHDLERGSPSGHQVHSHPHAHHRALISAITTARKRGPEGAEARNAAQPAALGSGRAA